MALKVRKNLSPPPPAGCELHACLDVIRGAWATHVIWSLRAGPRRFGELRLDLPQVSAKVLTARLRDLEARGVLHRTARPTSPPSVDYALSPLGARLVPALEAIIAVSRALDAAKAPAHRPAAPAPVQETACAAPVSGTPS